MPKRWAHVLIATSFLSAATFGATGARADDAPPPAVPVIQQLYACRAITDPAARLACFDTASSAVQTAESNNTIRIIDRATMQEARRGLFGFSLSRLRIFGHGNGRPNDELHDPEEIQEITAAIRSSRRDGFGALSFTLDNDQQWTQIDDHQTFDPRAGDAVHIHRGALGNYLANIAGRSAIRVRRVQ